MSALFNRPPELQLVSETTTSLSESFHVFIRTTCELSSAVHAMKTDSGPPQKLWAEGPGDLAAPLVNYSWKISHRAAVSVPAIVKVEEGALSKNLALFSPTLTNMLL